MPCKKKKTEAVGGKHREYNGIYFILQQKATKFSFSKMLRTRAEIILNIYIVILFILQLSLFLEKAAKRKGSLCI